MKAKKKPIAEKTPADYGVDVAPRLKVLKTTEPASRKAGRESGIGRRTGRQTQERSRGALMTTLLLAEVHSGNLNDATAKALTAAAPSARPVHVLVAGASGDAAQAASQLAGVEKVLTASGDAFAHGIGGASGRPDRVRWRRLMTPSSRRPPRPARTCCRASRRCSTWRRCRKSPRSISPDTFERPIYAGNADPDRCRRPTPRR